MVEPGHHLGRDALLVAVAALPLLLGPEAQGRQDLDPRPVVAVARAAVGRSRRKRSPSSCSSLVRATVMIGRKPCASSCRTPLHGPLEGAGAADRVVRRGGEAVDRDAEFQAVRRRRVGPCQPFEPFLLEDGAVGQHRGRAVAQRQFEDRHHVAVEERLAAGEVILLDAERDRFVEGAADGVQVEEAEAVVVRAATDEAVVQVRLQRVPATWNQRSSRCASGTTGAGGVEDRQRDDHGYCYY